jgi:hypothetical protein
MIRKFLWRVVKDNPVKILFIIGILFCVYGITHSMWSTVTQHTLNDQPMIFANKYYYTLLDSDQGHVETKGFDKPQTITNHSITYVDVSVIGVLSWIGLIILSICILVSSLNSNYEMNWGFTNHWGRIAIDMIKCYEQDGYYYYVFKDRLLLKTDYQMTGQYNTQSKFSELLRDYREHKNLFPEWLPLEEKRDRKLKALIG